MIFVNYRTDKEERVTIPFCSAVCGHGYTELILTNDDIKTMKRMTPNDIGNYFLDIIVVRLLPTKNI